MKTVSVSEAQGHFSQIIDEVLDGQMVVVKRGKRRVILKPYDATNPEVDFRSAFPPAPPEPRNAADRIRRAIRRVRRVA